MVSLERRAWPNEHSELVLEHDVLVLQEPMYILSFIRGLSIMQNDKT